MGEYEFFGRAFNRQDGNDDKTLLISRDILNKRMEIELMDNKGEKAMELSIWKQGHIVEKKITTHISDCFKTIETYENGQLKSFLKKHMNTKKKEVIFI